MAIGPGLFNNIGSKAKDELTKDYHPDTSSTNNEVRLFGLTYVSNILPSTWAIASIPLRGFSFCKFEVQNFQPHATFTVASDLNQSPALDISTTIGTPTFALGAKAGYDTSSHKFTKYDVGMSVIEPDFCASMILGDKGDTIKASYIRHLDELKKNVVAGEMTRRMSTNENSYTIGGTYAVNKLTVVKAKINNHGKLRAVLKRDFYPRTVLTISTEFDTKALKMTPGSLFMRELGMQVFHMGLVVKF